MKHFFVFHLLRLRVRISDKSLLRVFDVLLHNVWISDETLLLVFDIIITSESLDILFPVVLILDEALFLVLDTDYCWVLKYQIKIHLQINV